HTWATLGDGTPLVTATKRGKGMIVLFHVTADTRWSDLPLSGAFVEMLKRLVGLAGSTVVADSGTASPAGVRDAVPPSRVLDGFGAFEPPPSTARPVPSGFAGRATADHPPGFYGPPEGLLAVNTLLPADRLATIDFAPLHARLEPYRLSEPPGLRAPALLAAFALLAIDALVVFSLAGGVQRLMPRRRVAASLLIIATLAAGATLVPATRSGADPASDDFAMKSTLETRLAYVVTGDSEVDGISKAGLQGLTMFLAQRTALEAGEAIRPHTPPPQPGCLPPIYPPHLPPPPPAS